mgnify:CR=1 FL=1
MLGKTKMDGTPKGGTKLQTKNNKWCRYVVQAQTLVFAAMHLILGVYFVIVFLAYAIFEIIPINYRPILIEGRM